MNLNQIPKLKYKLDSGKNLALPDTLSRNTPPELLTQKLQLKYQKILNFISRKMKRLECKYAVKTDIDQSQINNL